MDRLTKIIHRDLHLENCSVHNVVEEIQNPQEAKNLSASKEEAVCTDCQGFEEEVKLKNEQTDANSVPAENTSGDDGHNDATNAGQHNDTTGNIVIAACATSEEEEEYSDEEIAHAKEQFEMELSHEFYRDVKKKHEIGYTIGIKRVIRHNKLLEFDFQDAMDLKEEKLRVIENIKNAVFKKKMQKSLEKEMIFRPTDSSQS